MREQVRLGAGLSRTRDWYSAMTMGRRGRQDTLTKQFASVAKKIGMKGFRLHDVRHCFASISLKQGTSCKRSLRAARAFFSLGHSIDLRSTPWKGSRAAVTGLQIHSFLTVPRDGASVRKCEKLTVAGTNFVRNQVMQKTQ